MNPHARSCSVSTSLRHFFRSLRSTPSRPPSDSSASISTSALIPTTTGTEIEAKVDTTTTATMRELSKGSIDELTVLRDFLRGYCSTSRSCPCRALIYSSHTPASSLLNDFHHPWHLYSCKPLGKISSIVSSSPFTEVTTLQMLQMVLLSQQWHDGTAHFLEQHVRETEAERISMPSARSFRWHRPPPSP